MQNNFEKYVKEIHKRANKTFEKKMDIQQQWNKEMNNTIKYAYEPNVSGNLEHNIFYREVYKLNQGFNGITAILKSFMADANSPGVEIIFSQKLSILLRTLVSFHYSTGLIQLLMEQSYALDAFGQLRKLFEEMILMEIFIENPSTYNDGLIVGNYKWGQFENFFNPSETNESQDFINDVEGKYTQEQLHKNYFWLEKSINRKFVASKEFKRLYGNDKILMHSWNMCHNLNHTSSMVLALNDKLDLHGPMSEYASQLIIFSIFKAYSKIIKEIMNTATNEKDVLIKQKIWPLFNCIKDTTKYIKRILLLEKEFFKSYKIK